MDSYGGLPEYTLKVKDLKTACKIAAKSFDQINVWSVINAHPMQRNKQTCRSFAPVLFTFAQKMPRSPVYDLGVYYYLFRFSERIYIFYM